MTSLKVVEDRDFDKHGGVSLRAIARAMWANIRAGGIEQGGSTLTQQLVRSYFLDNRRTLTRKLREALMSLLLELHFDKAGHPQRLRQRDLPGPGRRPCNSRLWTRQPVLLRQTARPSCEPQETALLIAVVRGPSYVRPSAVNRNGRANAATWCWT